MKNRPRLSVLLAALVIGMAFGFSITNLALTPDWQTTFRILGWLGFSILAVLLVYLTLDRMIYPRLKTFRPAIRIAWVGMCLLAGFGLMIALPWTRYPKQSEIKIIATGEKNPLAEGSEVWLASITNGLKTNYPGWRNSCRGDWVANEQMLVSSQNQPSRLTCWVNWDGPIVVRLGTHRWSGIAQVVYEDSRIERDLYSKEGGVAEVRLFVNLTPTERFFRGLALIANGISLAFLCLALSVWAITHPTRPAANKLVRIRRVLVFGLPIMGVWLIYLLAYWPGFLSKDSLNQFSQLVTGHFTDWHPAFHTMTLWLFTRVWFSPASVIVVQIVGLSLLLGWGFALVESQGTPLWVVWLGAAFLALSPAFGLILLNPWKDVAYSICVVALVLLILKVIISQGEWLSSPLAWISLGLTTALVALYRHNGAPVSFLALLLLFAGFRKQWKPLAAACIVALIFWAAVKGPIYSVLRVNSNTQSMGQNLALPATAITLLDWYDRSGIALDPDDQALVDHILNASDDADVRLSVLAQYTDEINQIAIRTAREYPLDAIKFFLERSSYIFQVIQPPLARIGFVEMAIYDNPYQIKPVAIFPWLKSWLTGLAYLSERIYFDWFFWRNAFWMYLLVFSTVIAWARTREWRYLLVIIPVLINALSLTLFSAGQITRYILPTLLVGPLLSGYFLFIQSRSTDRLTKTPVAGENTLP